MIWLYYFLNLVLTGFLLLPALSGLFFHIPLSKKLIARNLIKDEKVFIKIQWKRFFIFFLLYLIFTGISYYLLGIGALISTVVNCVFCISKEYKKIMGRHALSVESFLAANLEYFKDQETAIPVILEKLSLKSQTISLK